MPVNLPTLQELFVGEAGRSANWVVANVEPDVPWPIRVTKLYFRRRALFLFPPTISPAPEGSTLPPFESYPAVATTLAPGESFEQGQILIWNFLSSLSWVESAGIRVPIWSGGNLPRPFGGLKRRPIYSEYFYRPYLPDPTDKGTRWALAFYREGLSLNHVAYQCLSFFKVLNIFLSTSTKQKKWINDHLDLVQHHRAKPRISLLKSREADIGSYLYSTNRCAVAHAGAEPTADPENPEDLKRLSEDLPLVQALAELAIESHFGVKSAMTVYREHLYELAGFKQIFMGPKLASICSAGNLSPTDWPLLPRLSIRLALCEPYGPLEGMKATVVDVGHGFVIIRCVAENKLTECFLGLNFAEERLEVDVLDQFTSYDDGSSAASSAAAQLERFRLDYFGNGALEIREAGTDNLLGRRDPFIPTNVDLPAMSANFRRSIEALEAEARLRDMSASQGKASLTPASKC